MTINKKIGLTVGLAFALLGICLTIWSINMIILLVFLLGPTGHSLILPYDIANFVLEANDMLCVTLWFAGLLIIINSVFKYEKT